jgi:catechol 2,3-dioxygenase-like lactoylglutathione lyase family enzyme
MANLTFDGLDAVNGTLHYKGGLSGHYVIDPEAAGATFKFSHGDRIRFRRGPHANRGPVVVVGATGQTKPVLVVHDEAAGYGFTLAHCHAYADLLDKHDPEPVPSAAVLDHYVEVTGALGFRYAFNTDATLLDSKYGLHAGQRLHFDSLGGVATVVGEFLNVIWVTRDRNARAQPLVGGVNESALMSLHGMRDADASTGAISPRTPRTPGRNRDAPVFANDLAKSVASCLGSFNARVEVATDVPTLKVFGVRHGQKLVATRGVDEGKLFTVVGVKNGTLYVHIEGDKRVSMCRNCANARQLDDMYGFGVLGKSDSSAALSSTRTTEEQRSPRAGSPKSVKLPPAAAGARGGSPKGEALSPRQVPGAEPRPCWTAHGRVYFDISAKACEVFGYTHGQTVLATRGGDEGQKFHVFGVRHGNLWVLPAGSSRATALRYSKSKIDLDKIFGFKVVGRTELSPFYTVSEEPGKTPLSSPRRGPSASTELHPDGPLNLVGSFARRLPTEADDESPPRNAPPRDQRGNHAAASSNDASPQQQQSSSAWANRTSAAPPAAVPLVPKIALGQLGRGPTASGPAYTVASDNSSTEIADVGPSSLVDRTVDDAPFVPGQMPITRQFLKAYAHFKLGHASSAHHPLAFHAFYSEQPQKRLGAAMTSLGHFESHWRQFEAAKRRCTFSNATEQEILEVMRSAAHILN